MIHLAAASFSPNLYNDATDILSNDFMRYAFIGATAMAVLGGIVGYFVVLRHLAFAGEALSHVAFTAALGSVVFGFDPLLGMFIITAGIALGMGWFADYARYDDVAVGTVLAWVLGLGALLLSVYTSSASGGSNGQVGVNVLFGSILGIQPQQVKEALIVALIGAGAMILIARPLLFASLDPVVARVRGVPVQLVGVAFLGVIALTVAEAVQVVGALLVLSLLVMPAAVAHRWTARPARAMLLSAVLAVAFVWLGLVLGYYEPYPVSFFITTLAFTTYVATLAYQSFRKRVRRRIFSLDPAGP